MKSAWVLLGCAALFCFASGCKEKAAPAPQPVATSPSPVASGPRVELSIGRGSEDWGKIVLELDEKHTPITVRNFVRYVEEGYYDGTIFHRVMPEFMIQGGGQTAPGQEKTAGQHEPIANEALKGGQNVPGTIAMAQVPGDPHSATSEFFINVVDNRRSLDPNPPNFGYAVFGKVIAGMDVVQRIRKVETRPNPQGGENSVPVDPPVLRKAIVVK